jgi:two-component system CheB/CheR fusion protein
MRPNTPIRILLVEDHIDSAFVTRLVLERRGYSVRVAHRFHQALNLMRASKFDLMICDIMLPDGNGWDLVQRFKAQWHEKAIALSALIDRESIATSYGAGFDRHLAKPVKVADLYAAIESLMEDKEEADRPRAN